MANTEAAARSSARARLRSLAASTWAPRAKAAATRPARLGLIRAPGDAEYFIKYRPVFRAAPPGGT